MAWVPYASVIGSLMYTMVYIGDISQAISIVSKYIHNPIKKHWGDGIILSIMDGGLKFEQNKDFSQFVGYVDSDFARNLGSIAWLQCSLSRSCCRHQDCKTLRTRMGKNWMEKCEKGATMYA